MIRRSKPELDCGDCMSAVKIKVHEAADGALVPA